MNLNVPSVFACLMGSNPITIDAILVDLESQESHMASGDCGFVERTVIMEITRKRFALAVSVFGPDSPQAKSVLHDLGFHMYMASKFEQANMWAVMLECFRLAGETTELHRQYIQEAQAHLK